MVTVEQLDKEIEGLVEQKANFLAMFHQATGAIQALEQVRRLLATDGDKPQNGELSVADFAEIVGGPGATATIKPEEKP